MDEVMLHKGKVPEWTFIVMKNGKLLYLSSEKAVTHLSQQYSIELKNIADMRSIREEIVLDGKKELKKFNKILDKIGDLNEDIIIHCKMGLNRTPVAAAIFLVEKMHYAPVEAQAAVEAVLRKRKDDYVLDEMGCYKVVLHEVKRNYERRNHNQFFHQQSYRIREVDEINRQKLAWYG